MRLLFLVYVKAFPILSVQLFLGPTRCTRSFRWYDRIGHPGADRMAAITDARTARHKARRLFAVALNAVVSQLCVIVILESHLQSPALFYYPAGDERFFLWKN